MAEHAHWGGGVTTLSTRRRDANLGPAGWPQCLIARSAWIHRVRSRDGPPQPAGSRVKILLVNDYGILAGGAEIIVFGLREALRSRGHDVRVFASTAGAGGGFLADDACVGTMGRWRTLLQSGNPAAARALRRTIAAFEPDVVHVNLYLTQLSPLILREIAGRAAVYYAQWYRAICPRGTRWLPGGGTCHATAGIACLRHGCVSSWDWPPLAAQMAMDRAWGGHLTRVVAISRVVAERLTQFGAPHLRSPAVVYPGTPVVSPRNQLGREPTVFTACRLVPEKGVDVLLRAFGAIAAKYPTARLIVAGDGQARPALERLAVDLHLTERVTFAGPLSHAETIDRMRSAWAVCVPSRWEEPFGMIAAEAQMNGVAVIASRTGGLAEIVEDGLTGHLVPPGDVETLSASLHAIFADPDAAASLGVRGHRRAREMFGLDAFAARFEAIYRDAVAAQRDRA